jgi:alpha-galactosidase
VFIQWGYSDFFPANTVSNHVTDWNKKISVKFRTDVAMMGRLGYDINVKQMSAADLKFSQQAIQNYKRLSDVIWYGDLYRLVSPNENNRAVLMYVNEAKTKSVLFSYMLNVRYKEIFNRVKLQGLDPQKRYKVLETNLMEGAKPVLPDNGRTYSGDYLMTAGINLFTGRANSLSSSIIEITAE